MIASRRSRWLPASGLVLVAVVAIALLAVPAGAQISYDDVERAREKVRAATAQLEDQVALYDAAVIRQGELDAGIEELMVDLAARERDLVLARRAVRERVADMYMSAGTSQTFGAVTGIDRVPAKLAYLDTVAEADRNAINRLEVAVRDYERQAVLLGELRAEQDAVAAQLEDLIETIYTELEAANAEYQDIKTAWDIQEAERIRREEEERRRREYELWLSTSTTTTLAPATTTTAAAGGSGTTPTTAAGGGTTTTVAPPPPPPPAAPGVRVCPVDGAVTFRDSWGEARPGGRGHTGVDMMAATGTPLVAIESGVIWSPSWHYAGGIGLYIKGDSGDVWYYAHMNGYAPGIEGGTRVTAGQLVGYVGATGNASVPHLHLGYLPGGTSYANPYPVVAGIC
jgi:murein DD-endopeptidase MepM/ murein hydrolase activator NlpD